MTVVQLLDELTYVGARFDQRNCKQICNLQCSDLAYAGKHSLSAVGRWERHTSPRPLRRLMEVQSIKRKVGGFFSTYRSASVVYTEASPVKVGQLD